MAVPDVKATLLRGDSPEDLVADDFGEAPYAAGHSRVRVTYDTSKFKAVVSTQAISTTGGGTRLVSPNKQTQIPNGFVYDLGDLGLGHMDQVQFAVKTTDRQGANEKSAGVFAVNYVKRWSGSGLITPVLYVMQGDMAAFGVKKLAPSIGGGAQRNLASQKFPYLALDGLFTMNPNTDTQTSSERPYSAGVGGIIDFGGWFQAGATYRFKEKHTNAVIGIRETIWSRLTAK